MQISRIHPDFRPVWESLPPAQQAALSAYFLHLSSKAESLKPTRPKACKWYCPFGSQRVFPSGHRYCVNSFAGPCAHNCIYCYARLYQRGELRLKKDFCRMIDKDIDDLERYDVPAAPVHLSNSTDPFQELETTCGHTRYTLEQILAHRRRFTTVTILTKNPLLPVRQGYLDLLRALGDLPASHPRHHDFTARRLSGCQIQVSLAFWQDTARAAYDPAAPTVTERVEGIHALHEAGIPVVLRIDPLFPRSPLPVASAKGLAHFRLVEAQTLEDLEHLVQLAHSVAASHVVYSPLKIAFPRGLGLNPTMQALLDVYRALAEPKNPVWRGMSWRLPPHIVAQHVVAPFLQVCQRIGVTAKFCMQDLIEIP